MIFEFFNADDHKIFGNHYNKLRDQNRIAEVRDDATILGFWKKYPELEFSCALDAVQGTSIGLFRAGKKLFVIGVNAGHLKLYAKLEDFLKL